jgi:pimeloyl-ACP methyl ester carboxylesterase
MMVNVGGHRVAVEVAGGQDPPVVLVSSMGEPGSEWQTVQYLLATGSRLISYDRPATGASPGRPAPNLSLPYSAFAAELATMLDQVGIDPAPGRRAGGPGSESARPATRHRRRDAAHRAV